MKRKSFKDVKIGRKKQVFQIKKFNRQLISVATSGVLLLSSYGVMPLQVMAANETPVAVTGEVDKVSDQIDLIDNPDNPPAVVNDSENTVEQSATTEKKSETAKENETATDGVNEGNSEAADNKEELEAQNLLLETDAGPDAVVDGWDYAEEDGYAVINSYAPVSGTYTEVNIPSVINNLPVKINLRTVLGDNLKNIVNFKVVKDTATGKKLTITDDSFEGLFANGSGTDLNHNLNSVDFGDAEAKNVTSMKKMFGYCVALNSVNVVNLNVPVVSDMSYMFNGCTAIKNLDLNGLRTDSVSDMSGMFYFCSTLKNLNLNSLKTSSVKDMSSMFAECNSLENLNLASFNTASVTSMFNMFAECNSLENLNLNNFNTASVDNMYAMFSNCDALNTLNLANFSSTQSLNTSDMFTGEFGSPIAKLTNLTINSNFKLNSDMYLRDSTNSWTQALESDSAKLLNVFSNATDLIAGHNAMEANQVYTYVDEEAYKVTFDLDGGEGKVANQFVRSGEQAEEPVYEGKKIDDGTHYEFDGWDYKFNTAITADKTVTAKWKIENSDWERESKSDPNYATVTKYKGDYKNITIPYELDGKPVKINLKAILGNGLKDTVDFKILKDPDGLIKPVLTDDNFEFLFANTVEGNLTLTSVDFGAAEAKAVTSMKYMFAGCVKLNSVNIGSLNASLVSDMSGMFLSCSGLETLNLKGLKTAQVISMSSMFDRCNSLKNLNLDGFDTASATDMSKMFLFCSSLNDLDLSSFNTASVKNMRSMFSSCTSLKTLNLANFSTESVSIEDTSAMFSIGSSKAPISKLTINSKFKLNMRMGTLSSTKVWTQALASDSDTWLSAFTKEADFIATHNSKDDGEVYVYVDEDVNGVTFDLDGGTIAEGNQPVNQYFKPDVPNPTVADPNVSITKDKNNLYQEATKWTADGKTEFSFNQPINGYITLKPLWETSDWVWKVESGVAVVTRYQGEEVNNIVVPASLGEENYPVSINLQNIFGTKLKNVTTFTIADGTKPVKLTGTLANLFSGNKTLTSAIFNNIDASSITNTQSMFNGCSKLETINIAGFKQTPSTSGTMFNSCTSLKALTVDKGFSLKSKGLPNGALGTNEYWVQYNQAGEYLNKFATGLALTNGHAALTKAGVYTYRKQAGYLVTFDTDGGVGTAPQEQFVEIADNPQDTIAVAPTYNGTKEIRGTNYNFNHWVLKGTNEAYNFGIPLTGDITLKAQWNIPLWESEATSDGYSTVTHYNGEYENIVVPNELSGKPVKINLKEILGERLKETENFAIESGSNQTVLTGSFEDLFAVKKSSTDYLPNTKLQTVDFGNGIAPDVMSMRNMFRYCTEIKNVDFSSLENNAVTDMYRMFATCNRLTSANLSGISTEKVTTMEQMFFSCVDLEEANLSSFNSKAIETTSGMFTNANKINKLIISQAFKLKSDMNLHNVAGTDNKYWGQFNEAGDDLGGFADTAALITAHNKSTAGVYTYKIDERFKVSFDLAGGKGSVADQFVTENGKAKEPDYNETRKIDEGIYYQYDGWDFYFDQGITQDTTIKAKWAMENPLWERNHTDDANYATITGYTGTDYSTISVPYELDGKPVKINLKAVLGARLNETVHFEISKDPREKKIPVLTDNSFEVLFGNPSGAGNFISNTNLQTVDFGKAKANAVTNMSAMFRSCSELTSVDLSGLDAPTVTNMSDMFKDCSSLDKLNLENLQTSQVTDMSNMFSNCSSLETLDLRSFETDSVTNMSYMFDACSALEKLNVSSFDTKAVTNMQRMFYNCQSMEKLDLSTFNTKSVKNMNEMFNYCDSLTTLNLTNFSTESIVKGNYTAMFGDSSVSDFIPITSLTISNKFKLAKAMSLKGLPDNTSDNSYHWVQDKNYTDFYNSTDDLIKGHNKLSDTAAHTYRIKKGYQVTFSTTKGTAPEAQTIIEEQLASQPDFDDKDLGYRLDSWQLTGQDYQFDQPVTENIQLTANFSAKKYTIEFNAGSGTGSMQDQEMTYDMPTELKPNQFTKKGYSFDGWKVNGIGKTIGDQEKVENLVTSGTVKLVAQWKANPYKIIFDGNTGEGSMNEQEMLYDVEAELNGNKFTKTGYEFIGWKVNGAGEIIKDKAKVKNLVTDQTVTLVAQWKANPYTIVFDSNSGEGSMAAQKMVYDVEAELNGNKFTKTGYEFIGWKMKDTDKTFTDKEEVKNLVANGTVTLIAQWKANPYKIIFDGNTGEGSMNEQEMVYDVEAELNENKFTREGYEFTGWKMKDTDKTFTDKEEVKNLVANGTVTLIAQWKANPYKIIFDGNTGEGSMNEQEMVYDVEAKLNKNEFTKTGYEFIGWKMKDTDKTFTDKEEVKNLVADGTVTLIAQWKANPYTIKFDSNGATGSMDAQDMVYGTAAVLKENTFKKTGYTFSGWTTEAGGGGRRFNNQEEVINLITEGNITLFAQWKANDYTISFNNMGGEGTMASIPTKYDKKITLPANTFSKFGYTFEGWYTNEAGTGKKVADKATVENLAESGEVTLYADWQPKEYQIIFEADGGKGEAITQSFKHNEEVILPANTYQKTGYHFVGWKVVTKARAEEKIYPAGEPTKDLTNFVQDDIVTLVAVWEANQYQVKFDANGGSGTLATQTLIYDAAAVKLSTNTFARENYTFDSWNTKKDGSGEKLTDAQEVNNLVAEGSITLYAQWHKNPFYQVKFDANGGTGEMAEQEIFSEQTTPLTKNNFAKAGYTFDSWNSKKDGSGKSYSDEKEVTDLIAPANSLTLYAQWSANQYQIKFDANGGSGAMANKTMTFDQEAKLTANQFSQSGYTFTGWNTKADGSGDSYKDAEVVKNLATEGTVTLFAQWKKDKAVLEDLINQEQDKDRNQNDYTPESWKDYEDALNNAKEVMTNENATPEEINMALANLNQAIANLKPKEKAAVVDGGANNKPTGSSSRKYGITRLLQTNMLDQSGLVIIGLAVIAAAAYGWKKKQAK